MSGGKFVHVRQVPQEAIKDCRKTLNWRELQLGVSRLMWLLETQPRPLSHLSRPKLILTYC